YRGYAIHDLAWTTTFEEVAHLLWFGSLPDQAELAALQAQFAAQQTIPDPVMQVLKVLPASTQPMDALRTAVSAWGALAVSGQPTVEQAIAITARLPLFLAAFERLRHQQTPLDPRPELGFAANYLYLLTGRLPQDEHVRALNTNLVLLADHGMNASTFVARIVASTEADIASALVAALGALKGNLHGGAPARVQAMLQEIGTLANAEVWLRKALRQGGRLMGFGHRVYKTADPRSEILRELARIVDPAGFAIARSVEELALALLKELKPEQRLYTNVEYYYTTVMVALGLHRDLFTPTFALSRCAGWTAHILEQVHRNRLIRPDAEYIGPVARSFVPLAER
ncbi:MAG TPA: citrate/2-methylcitrate synthase, partial [Ktedonobacteraceae bacterium]|nr:citrate/2-methylcitrate synthase [Ktedonobacteraceae bacterium]